MCIVLKSRDLFIILVFTESFEISERTKGGEDGDDGGYIGLRILGQNSREDSLNTSCT